MSAQTRRLRIETWSLSLAAGAGSYRNFYLANQRMAQALQARGYHVHYDDCADAGHVDQGPLRQTLPAGLIWLWRGYKGGS